MISVGIATRSQAIAITVIIRISPINSPISHVSVPDTSIKSVINHVNSVANVKNKIIKIKTIKILCLPSAILYCKKAKTIATILKINNTPEQTVQVISLQPLFTCGINEQISTTILMATNRIVIKENNINLEYGCTTLSCFFMSLTITLTISLHLII